VIGAAVGAISAPIPRSMLLPASGLAILIGIAQETGKRVDVARSAGGLFGATTMPKIAVPFPLRRTTTSAVHPTKGLR